MCRHSELTCIVHYQLAMLALLWTMCARRMQHCKQAMLALVWVMHASRSPVPALL